MRATCVNCDGAVARTWYTDNQMPLFSWSSLAGGFLSGAFNRDDDGPLPAEAAERTRRAYGSDANYERLDRARMLGVDLGLTVPQVALAYAFSQPLNLFAIAGSESREEFAANASLPAVRFSPETLAWLDLRRETR